MGQGGEGFAQLQRRPEQEPLGFFPVVVIRRLGLDEARQPGMNSLQVVASRNLGDPIDGAIAAVAAIEIGRQQDVLNRDRRER